MSPRWLGLRVWRVSFTPEANLRTADFNPDFAGATGQAQAPSLRM